MLDVLTPVMATITSSGNGCPQFKLAASIPQLPCCATSMRSESSDISAGQVSFLSKFGLKCKRKTHSTVRGKPISRLDAEHTHLRVRRQKS